MDQMQLPFICKLVTKNSRLPKKFNLRLYKVLQKKGIPLIDFNIHPKNSPVFFLHFNQLFFRYSYLLTFCFFSVQQVFYQLPVFLSNFYSRTLQFLMNRNRYLRIIGFGEVGVHRLNLFTCVGLSTWILVLNLFIEASCFKK